MKFKEQYLWGCCEIGYIEACIGQWHQSSENGVGLAAYLGLTEQEYGIYLKTDLAGSFQELLGSQRRCQGFRIYQLDFEHGKTVPFAFAGIDMLHRAGYEQPPAAEYSLVYDGAMFCPNEQRDSEFLERIFERYNDTLPTDYHGRSVSMSDVVELYDNGTRRYFYCDTAGFVPVKFSPMLAKPIPEK